MHRLLNELGIAKLIGTTGILGAIVQAVPVDISWIGAVSKLGLDGLLSVAVIVLWRKLNEKDDLLMQNYKSMADALASNRATLERMSETLEKMESVVDKLNTVRNVMHGETQA